MRRWGVRVTKAKRFKPSEANEEYSRLAEYSELRAKELAPMLKPYVTQRTSTVACYHDCA